MFAPWQRIGLYLLGGGLALTLLDPGDDLLKILAVAGMIIALAYVDHFLARQQEERRKGEKVVSMKAFRSKRRPRGGPGGERERPTLRPAYASHAHGDVERLLRALRAEGVRPMMVTNNAGDADPLYTIMLSEQDLARAKPLIDRFELRRAKAPS